jgi:hypothetical protein
MQKGRMPTQHSKYGRKHKSDMPMETHNKTVKQPVD